MRICYISHSTSHFTRAYTDHFAARGHEVHLVSLHHADLPNVVNHHPLRRCFDPETEVRGYVEAAGRIRRIVRRINPDVVHAHYVSSNGVLAAIADIHPLIVTAHGSDIYSSSGGSPCSAMRRRLLRFVFRRADLINPVAGCLRDELLKFGVPQEKILLLSQGIGLGIFRDLPDGRRRGALRGICTRQLHPTYDSTTIIIGLQRLRRRGISLPFTFAASGPELAPLRRRVDEAGLVSDIVFTGGYKPGELPGLLRNADLYVSAARWDGASISLLEAMAGGLFPIVSDCPGNREWITGQNDGLLFRAGDPEDLANKLQQALVDHSLREGARAINSRKVAARGDRNANLSRLEEIYHALVHRSGQG